MVRLVAILILAAPALALANPGRPPELAESEQLIVVTSPEWPANHGTVMLLERSNRGKWQRVLPAAPVMLGRKGMAWGIGLLKEPSRKREGDGCSPAGVFELECVYGGSGAQPIENFPYRQLSDAMEGIDDPKSRFYNRLVDTREVKARDWTHSEKVRASNPMFRWCVAVKHNWQQRPGFGSCIYLHIWKQAGVPTSGCTAMSAETLEPLVHWLDARKRPLLVQVPASELSKLGLPPGVLKLGRPPES